MSEKQGPGVASCPKEVPGGASVPSPSGCGVGWDGVCVPFITGRPILMWCMMRAGSSDGHDGSPCGGVPLRSPRVN